MSNIIHSTCESESLIFNPELVAFANTLKNHAFDLDLNYVTVTDDNFCFYIFTSDLICKAECYFNDKIEITVLYGLEDIQKLFKDETRHISGLKVMIESVGNISLKVTISENDPNYFELKTRDLFATNKDLFTYLKRQFNKDVIDRIILPLHEGIILEQRYAQAEAVFESIITDTSDNEIKDMATAPELVKLGQSVEANMAESTKSNGLFSRLGTYLLSKCIKTPKIKDV